MHSEVNNMKPLHLRKPTTVAIDFFKETVHVFLHKIHLKCMAKM